MTTYIIVSPKWLEACGKSKWIGHEFTVTSEQKMAHGETMYHVLTPNDEGTWSVWSIRVVEVVTK